MRKTIPAAACAFGLMGGMPVAAGDMYLLHPEKAAFCVLETAMAALARMAVAYNCEQVEDTYDFRMEVRHDGNGWASVDYVPNVSGLVLGVSPDGDNNVNEGERWQVTGVGGSVGGLAVGPVSGTCTNDAGDEIMSGTSVTQIGGDDAAEATFINHLYWDPNVAEPLGIVAKGEDVLSQDGGWPLALWKQKVKYLRAYGVYGAIKMRKSPVVASDSARCSIRLRNAWVDDLGDRILVSGIVRVR